MLKNYHLVLCFTFIVILFMAIWNANVAVLLPKEYFNYLILFVGTNYALLGGYIEHKPQGNKRLYTYILVVLLVCIVAVLVSLYKDITGIIGLAFFVVGFLDCNRKYRHFK